MRRNDREKDETFALGVLRRCEYATLATVNSDGSPYCVPISPVLMEGKEVYFHCAMEGTKLDNIAQNSAVCLSCVGQTRLVPEKYTTEFESAVVMGNCTCVENEDEKISALRAICEKYADSNMEMFDKAIAASLHRTAVYKITINQITGKAKSYSK